MKVLERPEFTLADFLDKYKTEENLQKLKHSEEIYNAHADIPSKIAKDIFSLILRDKHPVCKIKGKEIDIFDDCINLEFLSVLYRIYSDFIYWSEFYISEKDPQAPPEDILKQMKEYYEFFLALAEKETKQKWNTQYCISHQYKNEDIIITDPCYILRYTEHVNSSDLEADTLYGDWGCSVYEKETGECLGKFCADGGKVCVAKLKDTLEVNPSFRHFIDNKPYCVTIIKNFSGTVSIKYESKEGDMICFVEGEGSTNFISKQTGF